MRNKKNNTFRECCLLLSLLFGFSFQANTCNCPPFFLPFNYDQSPYVAKVKIISTTDTIFNEGVYSLLGDRKIKPNKTNLVSWKKKHCIINKAIITECYKMGEKLGDTILRINDTIQIITFNSMCELILTSDHEYALFADGIILCYKDKQKGKYLKEFYLTTSECSGTKEMDLKLENDFRLLGKK